MERRGEEIHLDAQEARAGETPNVLRWMLGFGLALVIIAYIFVALFAN